MPGGDRTGPRGFGPFSGRGLGPCQESPRRQGRFLRRGRSMARGFRCFGAPYWEGDYQGDISDESQKESREREKDFE